MEAVAWAAANADMTIVEIAGTCDTTTYHKAKINHNSSKSWSPRSLGWRGRIGVANSNKKGTWASKHLLTLSIDKPATTLRNPRCARHYCTRAQQTDLKPTARITGNSERGSIGVNHATPVHHSQRSIHDDVPPAFEKLAPD